LQDIDYLNLPDGYVPDGMEVMQTARPHRTARHHGLDERTKEDRRKDRLAALEKARSARRAKADVSARKCAFAGMAAVAAATAAAGAAAAYRLG
jgi:hypothetical protein